MELVLILVGVAIVVIAAILTFFVTLRMMKESSYEEIAADKAKRQEAIEKELGIIKTRDIKKELKKKKKEKKEKAEEEEELDDHNSESNVIETLKLVKGKKPTSQQAVANRENTKSFEKAPEKSESKKKGKTLQTSIEKSAKTKASSSARFEADEFWEQEVPFILAESKNKRKNKNVSGEVNAPSKPSANQAPSGAKQSSPKNMPDVAKLTQKTSKVADSAINKTSSVNQHSSGDYLDTEWTTKTSKNDPLALLKKQSDEKNEEVKELRSQLVTANTRYVELRQELLTIRQNFAALESKAQNEVSGKVKEIEALKNRLSHTHVEHVKEVNQLNQQLRAPAKSQSQGPGVIERGSGAAQLVHILTAENKKLKEEITALRKNINIRPAPSDGVTPSVGGEDLQLKVKFMDDALKQNAVLLNASENAKKTLEQKVKQTEDKLNKLDLQLKSAEKKSQAGNDELKKSEAKIKSLNDELEKSKKESAKNQELLTKVKSAEHHTKELEEKITSTQSQFQILEQLIKDKDKEIESLKEKTNEAVANNEWKTEKEKLEAKLNESKEEQNKLQSDLLHYQTVLADTEKSLAEIHSKAESEERSWKQKLTDAEQQLHTSQEEVRRLQEKLDVIGKKHELTANHIEDATETNAAS